MTIDHARTRFLLAIFVACMFSGCRASDPDRARIIGQWVVEKPESMMRRIDQQSNRTDDEAPRMLLRFKSGGELETETRIGAVNQTKLGQWELNSFDETTQTMTITCTLQMQETTHRVLFLDEDTIELTPPNLAGLSTKLKFQRQ